MFITIKLILMKKLIKFRGGGVLAGPIVLQLAYKDGVNPDDLDIEYGDTEVTGVRR